MRIRSIIVCILGLAALFGAVASGVFFASFSAENLPLAWLFNLASCILVFMLGFCIKGGKHSLSLLLCILALCLPAAGPAIASLTALSIHFMRPARDDEKLFRTGNPVTARSSTTSPNSILGRPLVESVRKLSHLNLFRLLTGIGSLPPKDARPILTRLRDCDDAQLQLFAQGGLNDALDASERHLRTLRRRAQDYPSETGTHCAIAEINLYMLENHLVEEDDRPSTWDAASHAIGDALKSNPTDALSLTICARLNLVGGDADKARLAAESLAEIPGHEESAKLLLAEVAFEDSDFNAVAKNLKDVRSGSDSRDSILNFWSKQKPNYA